MHPNSFLRTFWRLEVRPEIFVAMAFDERYAPRFKNVIEPAITGIQVAGVSLSAKRVDTSKSGDSILTEIMDGICHARLVLADVSTVGRDSATGFPYRNANVMYEVGIALSCRQPCDVLLVRDDRERFLFDVSTIPHMTLDFTDAATALGALQAELVARLREQAFTSDARVTLAVEGLTNQEVVMLSEMADLPPGQVRGWQITGTVLSSYEMALARLTEKRLIRLTGKFTEGFPAYELAPLGRIVANRVKTGLPVFATEQRIESAAQQTDGKDA